MPWATFWGEGDGLFQEDTRVLSRFRLRLGGKALSLLGASVSQDNVFFTANLTNRPLPLLGGNSAPEGVIHIERKRFLWETRLYERITLTNFAEFDAIVPVSLSFESDFRDMFEVRGASRQGRGQILGPKVTADTVVLLYRGLDGVARTCALAFSERPTRLDSNRSDFLIELDARGREEIYIEVGPEPQLRPSRARFRAAAARARIGVRTTLRRGASVRTSGRLFTAWMNKSRADLALLTTDLPTGPYPYAGIPWFSTPFGRDAIVTALQLLWLDPSLARGVLTFLARYQATETSPFQDAAPGKILHETRKGEMAAVRELPFGQYYGGVDTTPLFVMLAGAYATRTGDMGLIEELWPSLCAAMLWIQVYGDSNDDGFVDYARGAESGLANQGWKDSHDSVFHADGTEATGPIALVEVQGYAYAALRAMAELAERRGEFDAAVAWRARSETLRAAVEDRFWLEELGYYALALDGAGKPCGVRASNAGHLLFTGLPSPERAEHVMAQLLAPPFNSGWGIRTLGCPIITGPCGRTTPHTLHGGNRPIRRARRRGPIDERNFRSGGQIRNAAARALLRFQSGRWRRAGRLPSRLPAAGLVGRSGFHDAAGMSWLERGRMPRKDSCRPAAASYRHRSADNQSPRRRKCDGRPHIQARRRARRSFSRRPGSEPSARLLARVERIHACRGTDRAEDIIRKPQPTEA